MKCILCQKEDIKNIGKLTHNHKWLEGVKEFSIQDCNTCGTRFAHPYNAINYDFIFDQTDIYKSHLEFARILRRQDDPSWALIGLGHSYYGVFDYLKGKKNLKILDVGCSYGYLTWVLNCMGHQTFGIDITKQAIGFATGTFGQTFYYADTREFLKEFPQQKFDLVVAIEVIEHLSQPMDFIQDCAELLNKKGNILITTPNKDFNQFFEDRKEINKDKIWMMEEPPIHFAIYGKQSMEYIAKENNLKVSFVDVPGMAQTTGPLNLITVFEKC